MENESPLLPANVSLDSGQFCVVLRDKTFHSNYCSLLSSVDRPGGVHKIRKTLHRIGLPRNMEYKCGSIDKEREVATGSATETKTGVLFIQYRTTVQTDAERCMGTRF